MPIERPFLPRVVVRFKQDIKVQYADHIGPQLNQLLSGKWNDLEARFKGIEILRLIRSIAPQKLEDQVRRSEAMFLSRRQFALSSYVIECPDSVDPRDLVKELVSLPIVEAAYVDKIPKAPQIGCPTNYLGPAASGGIDAQFANAQAGGDGNGEPFVDLELAWTLGHQAFSRFGLGVPLFGDM